MPASPRLTQIIAQVEAIYGPLLDDPDAATDAMREAAMLKIAKASSDGNWTEAEVNHAIDWVADARRH